MAIKGKFLEFPGSIEVETAKAYKFNFDFDHEPDWIPKSQSEWIDSGTDALGNRVGIMRISEWLCGQKEIEEPTGDLVEKMMEGDEPNPHIDDDIPF